LTTIFFYAAAFLMDTAFGLTSTALPWWATGRFNMRTDTLGALAITGAMYTSIALASGFMPDWLSPARRVLAGSFAAGCAMLMTGLAPSVTLLFAAAGLSSAGLGLYWPALQASLTEAASPEPLSQRVSRFNLSWSLGMMAGPLLCGYLYPLSHHLPFVAAAVAAASAMSLAGIGLLRQRRHDTRAVETASEFAADVDEVIESSEAGGERVSHFLLAAWVVNFASFFLGANVRYFYPLLATAHHVPFAVQGQLLMTLGAFQALTFMVFTRLEGWQQRWRTFILAIALVAFGGLWTAQAPAAGLQAIAFAMTGIGFGVAYSLSLFHSLHSPKPRRNSGIHEAIIGASGICGAFTGGVVAESFGLGAPFYVSAALVAAGGAVGLKLVSQAKRT